jgi:hypothetical protein
MKELDSVGKLSAKRHGGATHFPSTQTGSPMRCTRWKHIKIISRGETAHLFELMLLAALDHP